MEERGGLPAFRILDHQHDRLQLGGTYVVADIRRQSACEFSVGLEDWLRNEGVSLAFSTLDCGALFLVGLSPQGRLLLSQYGIDHSTGLAVGEECLFLATRRKMIRIRWSKHPDGIDRFMPVVTHRLGETDLHEIVIDRWGRVVAAESAHSCLVVANAAQGSSLLWKPDFITSVRPEDRCHLNGIALVDGEPCYVTAFCRSDEAHGWRGMPMDEGVVIAIADGRVVIDGLTRPHSPRFHDGQLFYLDSGRGNVMRFDPTSGRSQRVAFLPGFLRGLSFFKGYAAVTASRPRDQDFAGLPLDGVLQTSGQEPVAGVYIIDLVTGAVVHWIEFKSGAKELFDIVFLKGVVTPLFKPGFVD